MSDMGAGKSNVTEGLLARRLAAEVTDEMLDALEFRYAEPRACRVCGSELRLADTRGMKMTCTSNAASPLTGKHEAAGVTWRQALDHYDNSVMYDPPPGDQRVIALIAEVRRLRAELRSPAGLGWPRVGGDG